MNEIILGIYVIFVVAVLIWGAQAMIRIHNYFERRRKALDEWYQQEMEWLKKWEQEQEDEEEERPKVYCRDCAKRHNGCPLQVWCGPQDDDYCSRGVPKE